MKKTKEQKISAAKRKSIVVALALSIVLLISGTLALFTSRASSDFRAQAGTVSIEINAIDLTNSTNVNPGDNDPVNTVYPDDPSDTEDTEDTEDTSSTEDTKDTEDTSSTEDTKDTEDTSNTEDTKDTEDTSSTEDTEEPKPEYSHGTPHEFSYTVNSLGTKSARTRHTILITADRKGESTESLDASVFKLFILNTDKELCEKEIIDEESNIIIQGKYYILSNDEEINDLSKLEELKKEDETLFVKAVKYTWLGNIYDGLGKDITKGGNAEKEDPEELLSIVPSIGLVQEEDGVISETFTFDFAMMRTATNKYQGCDISIDVIAEAMQYRNTNDEDWALVTQVDKVYSSANAHLSTVPATNENKYGEELYPTEETLTTSDTTTTEIISTEEVSSTEEIISSEVESTQITENTANTSDGSTELSASTNESTNSTTSESNSVSN